jgi:hypothetical protein
MKDVGDVGMRPLKCGKVPLREDDSFDNDGSTIDTSSIIHTYVRTSLLCLKLPKHNAMTFPQKCQPLLACTFCFFSDD